MSNYYDRIAQIYDATRPIPQQVSAAIADSILQLVGATATTTFLEPGIGTGRIALPLIHRGYRYTGIDISEEMLSELGRKLGCIPENLTLIQADAAALPFADNTFDVVLTTHILQCLPDWLQGLAEIHRVLKPQGLYLSCETLMPPHQQAFESDLRAILRQYQPEKPLAPVQQAPPPTQAGIGQVLARQGATLERVTAAKWQVKQTVGELLKIYQLRAFGLCWSVPQESFRVALREFEDWCQQHYESFEVVLSSQARVDLMLGRDWRTPGQAAVKR